MPPTPTLILTITSDGLGVHKTDGNGNNAFTFHAGKRGGTFDVDAVNDDVDPNGAHHLQMRDFHDPHGNPCAPPFTGGTEWLPAPGGGRQHSRHTVNRNAIVGKYTYALFFDNSAYDPEIVIDSDVVKSAMMMKKKSARRTAKRAAGAKKKRAAKKKGAPKRGGKKTAKRRATRKKR